MLRRPPVTVDVCAALEDTSVRAREMEARARLSREHADGRDGWKSCGCGRVYSPSGWAALALCGWQGGEDVHALELRNCVACGSTLAVRATRAELESVVDRLGAHVSYQALAAGGWKACVTGIATPPHLGHGATAAAALAEVLTFALRIGALK